MFLRMCICIVMFMIAYVWYAVSTCVPSSGALWRLSEKGSGLPAQVMEFCRGGELFDRLLDVGHFTEPCCVFVCVCLVCVYGFFKDVYRHIYIYIHTHEYMCLTRAYIYMYTCTCTHISVCITCTSIYIYRRICIHVYMHIGLYV